MFHQGLEAMFALPTAEPHVSGRKAISKKSTPDNIVRNQSKALQPKCSVMRPTPTGPMTGPRVTPMLAYPINLPLSARVPRSATVAGPRAIVAGLPQ